jgi:hypothetical protein
MMSIQCVYAHLSLSLFVCLASSSLSLSLSFMWCTSLSLSLSRELISCPHSHDCTPHLPLRLETTTSQPQAHKQPTVVLADDDAESVAAVDEDPLASFAPSVGNESGDDDEDPFASFVRVCAIERVSLFLYLYLMLSASSGTHSHLNSVGVFSLSNSVNLSCSCCKSHDMDVYILLTSRSCVLFSTFCLFD